MLKNSKVRYRRFRSPQGLEIWVGQDDVSNDQISLALRHPNDLWFHVCGTPGSHVLLRCGESAIPADKDSIRMAAELAVFYSKQRDGGKTPVHYCPARQVGKIKGAPAGQVTIHKALKMNVYPNEHNAELIEDLA